MKISSFFFFKNKSIGLSLDFKHNYSIGKASENPYFANNFSLLFGPIFRDLNKEGISKSSYGIEFGFEDSLYGTKIVDNFIARIRIGIPFNAIF